MAKVSKAEFTRSIKGLRFRLHRHPAPKCTDSTHDASCAGRGKEISCNQITWKGIRVCVCTHLR